METMHSRDDLVDIQSWLEYDQVYTVEPVGKCGGLALLWKSSVQVDLKFVDKNLMDAQVQFGAVNFCVSCVYGDPDRSKRSQAWERISRIGVGRRDKWCMFGDFNDILHNGEKNGGPRRSDLDCKAFNEMIKGCDLVEMPAHGNGFTWAGRRGDHWIQCRLDRAFGNKEWFCFFPVSNQTFLDFRGSDHRPVLIKLMSSQDSYRGQFRFDKRFLFKEDVKEAIIRTWSRGKHGTNISVADRLRACRKSLSSWKKQNNLNSLDKINQLEAALEKEQSLVWPIFQRVSVLKKDLAKAYREEEAYWKQKSRQKWLRSGNRNSKYFHAAVKQNRQRKRIEKLKDVNGNMQTSEAAKGEVAAAYFGNLFKSSNPSGFTDWFSGLVPRVSEVMNESLVGEVSAQEIKEAVFSIKPASAPGPDGMSALFFQHYWSTVGNQVTSEVKKFFADGIMPAEWNYTHLCLIPKTQHPTEMVDLRPISLCSVLYKIISKIMAKRLQPWLPEIVSDTQSAFVSERLITDNILVAHELVHSLKVHPRISSEFMAVKSDMSKAYDRVEWSYLRSLLLSLGFHLKWVNWIMVCVSSVTYSVLINDCPFGLIILQRGLRQGDPLSPFLFVLCTEGLTHLLNKAQWEGALEGIQFSENGPMVHHLLFADDSLFLCKASREQSLVLQKILKVYGNATGQTINLNKSSITFGEKVDEQLKGTIRTCLGIFTEGGAGTYLGLPECFSGSKVDMLHYLKDRLKEKLDVWFTRCLSQGGKEVLLKSVALAMPVFAMSCFKLPITTCENLESAMASFWWDSCDHSRKIHWQSWERLCLPKDSGGLGFRDIQSFNQALLAKQAWRLLHFPDCLLSRLLKSRYFDATDFLDAALSQRPSFGWRSILFGRELLSKGLQKRVGDGASLFVWIDPWIDDNGFRAPWRKNLIYDVTLKVKALLNPRTGFWDEEVLHDLFLPEDILRIKAIKPVISQADFFVWKLNKSGDFSVKSAYWLAYQTKSQNLRSEVSMQPSTLGLKTQVWNLQTDPKIKIFLWKVLSGILPVAENLNGRGMSLIPHVRSVGISYPATDTVIKIRDDVVEWFEAQCLDGEGSALNPPLSNGVHFVGSVSENLWIKPPANWDGIVLLHSRRSFAPISSKADALLRCLLWAMESMASHKIDNIIFAFQDKSLIGAVLRPRAWPSFKAQSVELEFSAANRGANLIAQSVTEASRSQSYVAVGHPYWMNGVFVEERVFEINGLYMEGLAYVVLDGSELILFCLDHF
ncbi:F5A9.24 [Arabidopsis thaliana]|uniref:F5A9.24 n=1 Tax=Arabidopsis thaliana TaxID=3702 RepID=Q9FXJ5_ARATH|nr:F5A9.24 [Arabidopsis thaliana]